VERLSIITTLLALNKITTLLPFATLLALKIITRITRSRWIHTHKQTGFERQGIDQKIGFRENKPRHLQELNQEDRTVALIFYTFTMFECAQPDCLNIGINRCSICLREPYCSGDCQKVDWKTHKPICKTLKKLSFQLQPYREVVQLIVEIHGEDFRKAELNIRVGKHLLLYAEYQFGNRVPGKDYRERENGERIDNWTVEIQILIIIYSRLANLYGRDESLSRIKINNLKFPLYEKMLSFLRPWSADLDPSSTGQIDSMTKDQKNEIFYLTSIAETGVAIVYINRSQFNLVETHSQRSLSYARLYEGAEEKKTDLLCGALNTFYNLRSREGNYTDALPFAEEVYNCFAVAYNPVHPKVQSAASTLIECLTCKGDLCKAELFAQMTLDSLKDPNNGLDQQSEAVAKGYYDLANVIMVQKGDLVKAEKLVRESLRIRVLINSNNNFAENSISLLASILMIQGKLGSETKELFEQSLAISIRNYGPDGTNTAIDHFNFGIYNRQLASKQQTISKRKEYFSLSEIEFKEALRIYTKVYGLDDPKTLQYSSELSTTRRLLSEIEIRTHC
jgi:hypothetical protein